eukprot:m.213642 g.213642  ORF g.213642 m.213642 type:complete len:193 (-) comp15090_c0_seq1:3341-3919(-)
MLSLFPFYHEMLDVMLARGKIEFNVTNGGYLPETTTRFGTYNPQNWGCTTPPQGPSTNTYIRYHDEGNLELLLFLLDTYSHTQNASVWMSWGAPMASAILNYYVQRYPPPSTGQPIDFFPAQALETWQCPKPTDRSNCVTNPAPLVAGLRSVLPKLLALPPHLVSGITGSSLLINSFRLHFKVLAFSNRVCR